MSAWQCAECGKRRRIRNRLETGYCFDCVIAWQLVLARAVINGNKARIAEAERKLAVMW